MSTTRHPTPHHARSCPRTPFALALGALLSAFPAASWADQYHYVDWISADVAQGTAVGVITLPDSSTVTVSFAAINPDGSAGNLAGATTSGGINYWVPATPYISAEVENAPPDPDILRLQGGQNQLYQVTLSEAIRDPIMAIVSLGQPAILTSYEFDSPFTIVSQGQGYWGGNATSLVQQPNNVLEGREGHGTIRFIGTFSTFSWTVPTPEFWHGFTFGIRTTERIEPSDAGVEDAQVEDAADEDAGDEDAGLEDGGSAQDAASAPDGDTALDASAAADADTTPDASAAADGGPAPDASARVDAAAPAPDASSPEGDASVSADAGGPSEDSDGCDCAVAGDRSPAPASLWISGALALTLLSRRSLVRRRRPPTV